MKAFLLEITCLFCFSVPACAKLTTARASQSHKNVTTTDTAQSSYSSWFAYLVPPSRQQVKKDLERQWKQLEDDFAHHQNKLQQHLQAIHETAQATLLKVDRDLQTTEKTLKKRIEKEVLKQRQGWQRLRNSIRDHVGVIVGGAMTFAGSAVLPQRTSTGLQAAQLTWTGLSQFNTTIGFYDPWIKDAVATSVALVVASRLGGGGEQTSSSAFATMQTAIPLVTIALALTRSVGIVYSHLGDTDSPVTQSVLRILVSGIGTAVLYMSPLPLQLVATSVAGATLLYQSVVCEVVGNWFYMLQRLSEGKRRGIRQAVYHQIERKLLYPVSTAYSQIKAAIHNETLTTSLHDKVANAIHSSFQVRLVWAVATVGILFQVVLEKQLAKVVSSVWGWLRGSLGGKQPVVDTKPASRKKR